MRKIILLYSVIVLGLVGCGEKDVDYAYGYNIIYINETSSDIIVKTFCPTLDLEPEIIQVDEFIVPANEEYTDRGWSYVKIPDKFEFWQSYPPGTYAMISNGEKEITINIEDAVGIFNLDNYTRILENQYDKSWVYVFTDDFFVNGEPVTE